MGMSYQEITGLETGFFQKINMDDILRQLGEQLRREVAGLCRNAEVRRIKAQIEDVKKSLEENEKSENNFGS